MQPKTRRRRRTTMLVSLLAAGIAALAGAGGALPNAGDPDSTSASWQYVSGNSGPVNVTVTGTWSWGTNPSGGKDSQSCWSGTKPQNPVPGYNDVNGHWAVGLAVSWNDSSTPNVLTGKAADGSTVTLHVGNAMDWTNPNYCAGTSASAPYPSGTFTATHRYPSYAAFQSATNGGQMCANAYDVHQPNNTNESDPSKNGDNTLHNGHYALNVDCAAAQNANPSPPPSTPSTPSAPAAPAATPAAPAPHASLAIVKTERDDSLGLSDYVAGPITVSVGDRVGYQIAVTNTGDVALDVHLVDSGCVFDTNRGSRSIDFSGIQMSPGQTLYYHCYHVVGSADRPTYTNKATANGVSASTNAAPVASSVSAAPVSSSVQANVGPAKAGVLGASKALHVKKTVTHKVTKHVKKVTHRAKPAKAAVQGATFTG